MNQNQRKTYYDILGLTPEATSEEIRHAYHELARHHHPDVQMARGISDGTEALETRVFKTVTLAYSVLKNPKLRTEYDRSIGVVHSAAYRQNGKVRAFGVFGAGTPTGIYEEENYEDDDEANAQPMNFFLRILDGIERWFRSVWCRLN